MSDTTEEFKKITFATSHEEAKEKFEKYAKKDPFPKILPALLNSADICDYAAVTGMIHPFHPEQERGKLKTASYEVDLVGKVIYWDKDGVKITDDITEGKAFTLYSNSIAFVTPEPTFRLPDYIAVRFNLKITHVHRGILLGTGPLVDPGYEGKLLIPLHNLTANDYVFVGGEGFIWMEFTKISPSDNWSNTGEEFERTSQYAEFPENKKLLDPETLIAKALKDQKGSKIQSSITHVFVETRKDAQRSKEEAQKAKEEAQKAKEEANNAKGAAEGLEKKLRKYSLIGLAMLGLALVGIVLGVFYGNRQFIIIGQENLRQIEAIKHEVKELKEITKEIQSKTPETSAKTTPRKPPNEKTK